MERGKGIAEPNICDVMVGCYQQAAAHDRIAAISKHGRRTDTAEPLSKLG
jgi:hypothetical protein